MVLFFSGITALNLSIAQANSSSKHLYSTSEVTTVQCLQFLLLFCCTEKQINNNKHKHKPHPPMYVYKWPTPPVTCVQLF